MVKNRLAEPDAQSKGWLLDGYPRSESQGRALEKAGIHPELFILLDVRLLCSFSPPLGGLADAPAQVPDDVLIERVVGRRLDPVTGKIYHMTFSPPPADLLPRLTVRSDDTEEKARNRLAVHARNVDAVRGMYGSTLIDVDGNRDKRVVFDELASKIKGLRHD